MSGSTRMIPSRVGSAGILPAIVCPKKSPAERRRYLNLPPSRPHCARVPLSSWEMQTRDTLKHWVGQVRAAVPAQEAMNSP